jgi:hypothetical protein
VSGLSFDVEIKQRVTVPVHTRWLDEFIGLKCAPDLIGLFPNAKEITESMACFGALRRMKIGIPELYGDPDVVCLVPGDGHKPRTGAVVACRTKWTVHSVDPVLRVETVGDHLHPKYQRLYCWPEKVANIPQVKSPKLAVILAVHSHAYLRDALYRVNAPVIAIVALQCCTPQVLDIEPTKVWRDAGVYSPENLIKTWVLHYEERPNQCDGCLRGMPIRDGVHYSPDGSYDMIGCTKHLYRPVIKPREDKPTWVTQPEA